MFAARRCGHIARAGCARTIGEARQPTVCRESAAARCPDALPPVSRKTDEAKGGSRVVGAAARCVAGHSKFSRFPCRRGPARSPRGVVASYTSAAQGAGTESLLVELDLLPLREPTDDAVAAAAQYRGGSQGEAVMNVSEKPQAR